MKLNAAARKALPKKDFALPGGGPGGKDAYPDEDAAHARAALSRVSANGTPAEKKKVRAKVHRDYPTMQMKAMQR